MIFFFHAAIVAKSDGTVEVLGDSDTDDRGQYDVPAGLNTVVAVGGGYFRGLALKDDGSVVAWGGRKDQPERNEMVPLGLGRLKAISAKGSDMSDLNVGLRENGAMVVWNRPRGSFFYTVTTYPLNVVAVAAGWSHFLALYADGSVHAWGHNDYGQCDVPPELR